MRCEIDREVLAENLAVIVNALPSRTTYPVLQNVLVEVAGGKLALSGTDLDMFVRKELALEGDSEDGKVVVPGRKLMEITRELGSADVRIYSKDAGVHVEAGASHAVFSGLDPAEFPETPKLPEGAATEFGIAELLELLEATSFAVSHDDSRPAMCGVNWEVTRTEMRMVATDGHRLAYIKRPVKGGAPFKAIVSPKLFAFLPKGQDRVSVYSDPSKVGLATKDTTIVGRLIEGPYPDYERVIPKGGKPSKATLELAAFIPGLRRASVFAHPVGRLVAFQFGKDAVKLTAETPDLGRSEEEVPCDFQGKEIRIGLNAAYLIEILKHLNSDKATMELQGPLAAGVVTPVDPDDGLERTFLVMPIRLD